MRQGALKSTLSLSLGNHARHLEATRLKASLERVPPTNHLLVFKPYSAFRQTRQLAIPTIAGCRARRELIEKTLDALRVLRREPDADASIAALGVHGYSGVRALDLRRLGAARIFVWADMDGGGAGEKEARLLAGNLNLGGLRAALRLPPAGEDPASAPLRRSKNGEIMGANRLGKTWERALFPTPTAPGLSPPTRGNHSLPPLLFRRARSIPAHAG